MQHHTALTDHDRRSGDVRRVGVFIERRNESRHCTQELIDRLALTFVARNGGRKVCGQRLHYVLIPLARGH
jgi:hypothetical protein